MSDWKNDSNSVKHSHNIIKNRKCGDVERLGVNQSRVKDSNINIMKTDSYNFLIGCIILVNFMVLFGMYFIFQNNFNEYRKDTETKLDILQNYIITPPSGRK